MDFPLALHSVSSPVGPTSSDRLKAHYTLLTDPLLNRCWVLDPEYDIERVHFFHLVLSLRLMLILEVAENVGVHAGQKSFPLVTYYSSQRSIL